MSLTTNDAFYSFRSIKMFKLDSTIGVLFVLLAVLFASDLCGPTPSCSGQSVTETDQFEVGGHLFSVTVNPPAFGSYTQITYAIASSQTGYFTINDTTGRCEEM